MLSTFLSPDSSLKSCRTFSLSSKSLLAVQYGDKKKEGLSKTETFGFLSTERVKTEFETLKTRTINAKYHLNIHFPILSKVRWNIWGGDEVKHAFK